MPSQSIAAVSQRDLVLASLRRGIGRDNCAGAKNGLGTLTPSKPLVSPPSARA
jgi:hypothetical protein